MITITASPDDISSVNRPVVWDVTSNRYDPDATLKTVVPISGEAGGIIKITIPNHGYQIADVIEIIGTTSYNGIFDIIAIVDTSIFHVTRTTQPVANQVGSVKRLNNNFQISATTRSYNENRLNIVTVENFGGNISIQTNINHGYKAGDRVFIEGTTTYNGFHKVLQSTQPANKFVIEATFGATSTGTVIRGIKLGETMRKGINVNGVDLFRFDISNFLKTVLSFNLSATNQTIIQTPNDAVISVYEVAFLESWENAVGLRVSTADFFSSEKRVINSTLQHRETQDMNVFTQQNSLKRFLTNIPPLQSVRTNEELQLSFINVNNVLIFPNIIYQSENGQNLTNPQSFGEKIIIGKHGIVTITSTLISQNANAARFQIFLSLATGGSGGISETKTFLIDRKNYCDSIRIWFQNRLSGMDPYTFTGRVVKKQKSKKELFKKIIQKGFSLRDRGAGISSTETEIIYEVSSEFLTPEQLTWLSEMLSSPEVFMQEGTNLIPIIIVDNDEIIQDTEDLQQFKIKFIEANEIISQ